MAWSPPAHNAGIVWVSAPGDYATFNSNHTPDGTSIAALGLTLAEADGSPRLTNYKPVLGPLFASGTEGSNPASSTREVFNEPGRANWHASILPDCGTEFGTHPLQDLPPAESPSLSGFRLGS
jgi:hypothetical protein